MFCLCGLIIRINCIRVAIPADPSPLPKTPCLQHSVSRFYNQIQERFLLRFGTSKSSKITLAPTRESNFYKTTLAPTRESIFLGASSWTSWTSRFKTVYQSHHLGHLGGISFRAQATATTAAEGSTYAQAQRFVLHRLNELTGLMNSQGSGYAQAQRFVLHRLNELAGLMQGLRGPHRGRCLRHLRG